MNNLPPPTQQKRQEVGYVLLEKCEVLCSSTHSTTAGVWYNVNIQPGTNLTNAIDGGDECAFAPCDLVLQPSSAASTDKSMDINDNNIIFRNANEIIPFNGLLPEMSINEIDVNGNNIKSSSTTKRSDASLLAGLCIEIDAQADAFEQQNSDLDDENDDIHLRQLRTESVQIMFWKGNDKDGDQALSTGVDGETQPNPHHSIFDMSVDSDSNSEVDVEELVKMKASMLVTFSLPIQTDGNGGSGNVSGSIGKKKKTSKSKMLSSGLQLLGSVIRCDWDYLATNMNKLQHKAIITAKKEDDKSVKKPFFPTSMNVEELYENISGAGKHNTEDTQEQNGSSMSSQTSGTKMTFLDLPIDIISTSIASYLRAPSLHALRVTNRKLQKILRPIVPGLKLKLFQHQIRSLEWMEMRERRCITEGDLLRRKDKSVAGEAACGGDDHRAVTGGATVLLRPKPDCVDTGDTNKSLRFDSLSGCKIEIQAQSKTLCARGGLLCDDPGLGKTITVLSLILRSFGLSTQSTSADETKVDDNNLFYTYWSSTFLTQHVRRPAILKLITSIIKSDRESGWFTIPVDLDVCPDYLDIIAQPMCLQDLRIKYDKEDCLDFKKFEEEVRLCISNAKEYNPPDSAVYEAAERLMKKFENIILEFKEDQLRTAAKSIKRMSKDENTRHLVDAFETRKKAEIEETLIPSTSSLLVVPSPLLQHWEEQILQHIDFNYLLVNSRPNSPLIYYHTTKRTTKAMKASNTRITFDLKSVKNPLIFIDDGSKELPSESILSRFPIVLTSYNRFTADWKAGSVEQELRSKGSSYNDNNDKYWGEEESEASSLLKVHWLRVIVDEGHVMGKNSTNMIQFASWLKGQRHWGMTGTPTQQIATSTGLRSLYFLINYLRHDFFSKRLGREKTWNSLINQGFKEGNVSCFFRLKHLISFLMVRHTKADLVEIPPPVYSTKLVELSHQETTTYNTIVSAIKANITTTSMEGKTSGWQDSLFNPRQAKYAAEGLKNLRVACCGGTHVTPIILPTHWNETLEMCREIHQLDDIKVKVVNNFIRRATSNELSSCNQCGIQLQTLFVVPCGCLLCVECIDSKTRACPLCTKPFDVDDFQRLQPGLNNQFNLSIEEEKTEREQKFALKRAFSSSSLEREADIEESDEAEAILPPENQVRKHKKGESCVYSKKLLDGKCIHCRQECFDCNFMDNKQQQCSICHKHAEDCPTYASKSKYCIDKLLELKTEVGGSTCTTSPMAARLFARSRVAVSQQRPVKVIVYSQIRDTYEYFGDRLIRRFGGACVADYSYGGTRAQELDKFIHNPECFVMLLSKQGSVGLDLSFVTHIFFLESLSWFYHVHVMCPPLIAL